jgi:hypothetical protein
MLQEGGDRVDSPFNFREKLRNLRVRGKEGQKRREKGH